MNAYDLVAATAAGSFSLITSADDAFGSSATSPETTLGTLQSTERRRKSPDTALVLGLLFAVAAGTGGFVKPAGAQATLSSSRIWVDARHGLEDEAPLTGAADEAEVEAEEISTSGRIAEIRSQLSLNVKQLAEAMLVGRPAVYGWSQGVVPRETQQVRLRQLYDIAQEWKALSRDVPIGKHLITPPSQGASMLRLLCASELDREHITRVMKEIASAHRAAEGRRQVSGYKSAASVMAARGIKPAPRDIQNRRVGDAADLG